MKFRYLVCLLLFSVFVLNSCIDITEEISIRADGSGSINLAIDIGALGGSASNNNGQFDLSFLDYIKKIPVDAPHILGKIEGIKNIHCVNDDKKGIYSVGFDFANSRVLNKAIYNLAGKKKTTFMPSFFKISKHKLIKKDVSPYLRMALKKQQKKSYNNMFFSFISYKNTFHFPAEVKKVSNIKSERPDAHTVTTKFTLDEMLKGGFDFGNKIRF